LAAARLFLFGARDVWFVVAVPVFFYSVLGWSFSEVGAFMALWVIGYGFVQASAPAFVRRSADGRSSETRAARAWVFVLMLLPAAIVAAFYVPLDWRPEPATAIVAGLALFGAVFAVNSSVHSYLILAYTDGPDDVALNVGFYYMANAAGRLLGTLLSGLTYQAAGLEGSLLAASALLAAAFLWTLTLPVRPSVRPASV
jgi:predicted MFS family arabinose efflux permease